MSALKLDNPFWRFSVAVYAQPGVSQECLALQDSIGIDVNILLFSAWLGAERRILITDDDLDRISDGVREWHEQVVRPLRTVRRVLRPMFGDTPLREKVKLLELEAEQYEQTILYTFAPNQGHRSCMHAPRECVSDNIRRLLSRGDAIQRGDSQWPARLVDTAVRQVDKT